MSEGETSCGLSKVWSLSLIFNLGFVISNADTSSFQTLVISHNRKSFQRLSIIPKNS